METRSANRKLTSLAVSAGVGAELRRPLGITVVGGLLLSQADAVHHTGGLSLSRSPEPFDACEAVSAG
jgi:hypothetical protein